MEDIGTSGTAQGTAPKPEDIFTPRAPAGRRMFVSREIGPKITNALNEMGAQLIVYGDTGAGKTTLVLESAQESVARVECHQEKSFTDLIRDAFGSLGMVQELRMTTSNATELGAEVGAGLAAGGLGFVAKLTGRVQTKSQSQVTKEVEIIEQPLVDALLTAMGAAERRVLFLDNFDHIVSDNVKRSVAELMIAISDRADSSGNIKIVVAGIADSAGELLGLSDSASRRTISVRVAPMRDNEIREIIARGMGILAIAIDDDAAKKVADLSRGYPYVTHLICLHAARLVIGTKAQRVDRKLLGQAIRLAVEEFELDLETRFRKAIEHSGVSRPRTRILYSLADSRRNEWTFGEVRDEVEASFEATESKSDYTYLNIALGKLQKPEYGGLIRSWKVRGKTFYAFANPLAPSYIQMLVAANRVPWLLGE